MKINHVSLETVERERERESYTLIARKIIKRYINKKRGILHLYEDTG